MTRDERLALQHQYWLSQTRPGLTPKHVVEFVEEFGLVTLVATPALQLPALERLVEPPNEQLLGELHLTLERCLAAHAVVEVDCWPGHKLYIPDELLPFCYALVGDRRPQLDAAAQVQQGKISRLAGEVFEVLLTSPPLTAAGLRDLLGAGRVSTLAVERALAELTPTLKIIRVGLEDGAPLWQPLVRIDPETTQAAQQISRPEALAALISKLLGSVIVATEDELAQFFHPVAPLSRTRAALRGLQAGRELIPESLDGEAAVRLAHHVLALDPPNPDGPRD